VSSASFSFSGELEPFLIKERRGHVVNGEPATLQRVVRDAGPHRDLSVERIGL
jgi:hypothetical protein